jgi:hypothetical protein
MSASSIKSFTKTQTIDNPFYNCRYVLRDYGDYRTISKVLYVDGAWDLASRVDEYVIWQKLTPQRKR